MIDDFNILTQLWVIELQQSHCSWSKMHSLGTHTYSKLYTTYVRTHKHVGLPAHAQRHNPTLFSGGGRWTGVWLPSHLKTSQVLYPHSPAHCVDTEMSACDKWNDKFRGRCGGVIFPRLINISSCRTDELRRGSWMDDSEGERDHQQLLFVGYLQFVFITHGPLLSRMYW